MKYNILKLYTEKLDLISFQNFVEDETVLGLIVNFHTSLLKTDYENIRLLKIEYTINASNAPISLNWIGTGILEFEDVPPENLNAEPFLDNDIIKDFIESSIQNISSLIGGDLPNIYELRKGKDED